jgi:hypothetical protein
MLFNQAYEEMQNWDYITRRKKEDSSDRETHPKRGKPPQEAKLLAQEAPSKVVRPLERISPAWETREL